MVACEQEVTALCLVFSRVSRTACYCQRHHMETTDRFQGGPDQNEPVQLPAAPLCRHTAPVHQHDVTVGGQTPLSMLSTSLTASQSQWPEDKDTTLLQQTGLTVTSCESDVSVTSLLTSHLMETMFLHMRRKRIISALLTGFKREREENKSSS